MILRIVLGVGLAGAVLITGYLYTSGDSSPAPAGVTVTQPRVVQPVAPTAADNSRREAIEGLNLRGN